MQHYMKLGPPRASGAGGLGFVIWIGERLLSGTVMSIMARESRPRVTRRFGLVLWGLLFVTAVSCVVIVARWIAVESAGFLWMARPNLEAVSKMSHLEFPKGAVVVGSQHKAKVFARVEFERGRLDAFLKTLSHQLSSPGSLRSLGDQRLDFINNDIILRPEPWWNPDGTRDVVGGVYDVYGDTVVVLVSKDDAEYVTVYIAKY